ncbi:hypothetical protein JCM3775_002038 [Rhodotorula graminis]|uniref:MADS-box domain-containing protein n=1 Tax=Rhodotorula graminis (strain WP1) TaxID=578459 RepID=A0A194S0W8_RHOGW|nr:uncharacterized protein RHOBADRAFT_54032 [Rhodotorula graminis WP1]KPV74179.1 hypothetical protein RHOBADRAFT_54032 [Rhodotorula graminis WP1]
MDASPAPASASPAPPPAPHAGPSSQPYLAQPGAFAQQPHANPSPVSPGAPLPDSQQQGGAPPPPTSLDYPSTSSSSLLPAVSVESPADSSSAPAANAPTTRSSTRPQRGAAPAIVAFDPTADGSDDDDDDDGAAPKKKQRTTARARGAAASTATVAGGGGGGAASGGSGSGAEGPGEAAGEGVDPDKGRRKIEIEYIQKKEKRHITFSKRKAGIMKKAYELATLTGTEVLLLVVSETGIVYTFTTTKFQPLVGANPDGSPSEGQRLIQRCLAVDPDEESTSNYISPPPDGPLLPLPPAAQKRPFEANSKQHGGQIALRTRQQRPRTKARPAPIVPPAPSGSSSLPTPTIHGAMDQMQQMPPSPHRVHPLNQAPPGSLADYPPSPGYGQPRSGMGSELPSPMHPPREYQDMMEHPGMNGRYAPSQAYPPPPALGYTHQLPNPNRPPHPLDPYPHPHHSPSSSPRQPRHLPPPPGHYQSAAPRSVQDPYAAQRAHYGEPPPGQEDMHMLSPQHQHLPPPPPHLQHMSNQPPPGMGLPQPPPELYMQHAPQQHQGGGPQGHPGQQQQQQGQMYDSGQQDTYMRR